MKRKSLPCLTLLVLFVPGVGLAQSSTIFESASLGATGQTGGFGIKPEWIGVRFTTTEPYRVTGLGAHLGTVGPIFIAVFPLKEDRLPPSPPNVSDAVNFEIIRASGGSAEVRVDTDFELEPGDWAVVVGYDATIEAGGLGWLPTNNTDIGGPQYLRRGSVSGEWEDDTFSSSFSGFRFFVEGEEVHRKCGDGFITLDVEACDDGNVSNADGCLNGCRLARCGDGFVYRGVEQCDDSNARDGDGCSSECEWEIERHGGAPRLGASGDGGCHVRTGSGSRGLGLLGAVVLLFVSRRRARTRRRV